MFYYYKTKEVFIMLKSITPNLMVENVEETVEFYETNLGFSKVNSVQNIEGGLQFAIIAKDNLLIMFQEKNNFILEYPVLNTQVVHPSISLYIETQDLHKIYEHLKEKVEIYHDIHTTFYGKNEFAIIDNNGYILTFTE